MKTMWFHLMSYPHLPADFRERYSSVWVDLPGELFDAKLAHAMYNDDLDELQLAAELGFDAICVNEHHSTAYGTMPAPGLMASALARATRDTAICILGNSLALYNPPIRVAEEVAMLDCISGGRVIAGFPVGTPMDACFAYSQNPSTLRDRWAEAYELITRAWREPEAFAFDGRYTQMRYVNPWPKPYQDPHPPIWIPGGASAETWSFCAEREHVYCHLSYYGYKAARDGMQGFWREVERAGRDRNPYRAGYLQFVGVAESREEAMKLYKEPAEYFYGNALHVDPRYGRPAGYMTEASMRAGLKSQVGAAAAKSRMNMAVDKKAREIEAIVDNGYVVVGSPDEVAEQLRTIATDLNVGHLLLLMNFGNMSRDLTEYNTRLFAEKVMPQLRDLFSEWDDPWWPTGAGPAAAEARSA